MSDSDQENNTDNPSRSNDDNKLKSDAKQERLAEALRANLRRRKVQNRERS
ncbi:hypothetical protein [Kordiimonas sp. SCSIO 12610]|uniref:hypothetical protein n=1 Tax=Kordiimonas sp. SCSIO 12610 TaxID=2829597 RepID=UPI0021087BEC|nr:hypothetical protein [Kordiimonas sp. SCSIO 12610]UTW55680.1 hypothetical protein KFF44_01960 [Kordiimonas sp. SCSIO 12610]